MRAVNTPKCGEMSNTYQDIVLADDEVVVLDWVEHLEKRSSSLPVYTNGQWMYLWVHWVPFSNEFPLAVFDNVAGYSLA